MFSQRVCWTVRVIDSLVGWKHAIKWTALRTSRYFFSNGLYSMWHTFWLFMSDAFVSNSLCCSVTHSGCWCLDAALCMVCQCGQMTSDEIDRVTSFSRLTRVVSLSLLCVRLFVSRVTCQKSSVTVYICKASYCVWSSHLHRPVLTTTMIIVIILMFIVVLFSHTFTLTLV